MKDTKIKLVQLMLSNKILKFGDFTLKSGEKSWFYLDLRIVPSFPEMFEFTIGCFIEMITELEEFDAIAGIAVAGIPFSSVLGFKLCIPSLIVRPQKKEHGLKKLVEGDLPEMSSIILIDDLITTGSSKIPSINAIREEGFLINDLVVLVDRRLTDLQDLVKLNVKLHSFITIDEIFQICLQLDNSYIGEYEKKLIKEHLE